MGQGGTAKTDDNKFTNLIVAFIKENPALEEAAKEFLEKLGIDGLDITDKDLKNMKDVKDILKLLEGDNGINFLSMIVDHLSYDHHKNVFIKEFGQNPNMVQKADTLGKNIAIGVTSVIAGGILGGAIGANFGAISAGLGAAGAGAAAFAPFIAIGAAVIVAIALIALAIYHRKAISENIKGGAKYVGEKVQDIGEGVMHSLKNFIDWLSTEPSNAVEYVSNCYKNNEPNRERVAKGDILSDDAAFIKQYLLNKDGFKALENFIKAEAAEGKKIKLDGTDIELTVESLERLKEKGDSKLDRDKDGFIEELSKFKLIMSGANEHIRKEVEAKQDKIHTDKKLETPLPSSALYPGSNANTELLLKISEQKRNGVKGLLREVSKLENEFRTGEDGLYEVLAKGPPNLLDTVLKNLEGNDIAKLPGVVALLEPLEEKQITEFRDTVSTLKEKQLQPRTGMDKVQEPVQLVGKGGQEMSQL